MKLTQKNIDDFLSQKKIAVAGASAKKQNFGNSAIQELKKKGYTVFPLHPDAETVEGLTCFKKVEELPSDVTSVYIATNKKHTNCILTDSYKKGIRHFFVQQMSDDENTLSAAGDSNLITGQCFFMHLAPVRGIHRFHRSIKKLFGKLPK